MDTENYQNHFYYQSNFFDIDYLDKINQYLADIDFWHGVTDKDDNIIRKQRWYHLENKPFHKDWTKHSRWLPFNYDDFLIEMNNYVEEKVTTILNKDVNFNSLLLNYYENNDNKISPHKDNSTVFGKEPIIVIISIGCDRNFMIEKTIMDSLKKDKINPLSKVFKLENNSIMIMSGLSQRMFKHSILKEENKLGERYSLTFRYHYYN